MVHSSGLVFRQREDVIGWKHTQVQTVREFHTGALFPRTMSRRTQNVQGSALRWQRKCRPAKMMFAAEIRFPASLLGGI